MASHRHRVVGFTAFLRVGLLVLVGAMVLYPLAMVIAGSFWSSSPGSPGHFTLDGYVEAYGDPHTYSVLVNTLLLALVRTALAVSIAFTLAWLLARTNIPFKGMLELCLVFLFFLPLMPNVIAWILMLSPRTGLINVFFEAITPFHVPAMNIYSYGGIVWVSVLNWVPLLYIFLSPAFRGMDATLEEASRMSGMGVIGTIRYINLPLLAPAVLATTALAFVRMMESFTIEAMLGFRANIYVFTTQIYRDVVFEEVPRYPPAMALAVTLLVITIGVVALQWKMLGNKEYTTITGRAFQARPIRLRRWRWPIFAVVSVYILVSMVLPTLVLLWVSFMKVPGVFMEDMYTLAHYTTALADDTMRTAFWNTLILAVTVATVGMALCSLVSYVVVKTRFPARRMLDLFSWIPWAVPSVVLGLGFLWGVLLLDLPFVLYGSLALLCIALVVKGLPLGTRTMTTTLVQISSELEHSARVHGASWLQTFVRIILPLLAHGFVAGWILLFALAVKDLETVILLYSTRSTVISTQVFRWWSTGNLQAAIILAVFESLLIAVAFVAARLVGGRVSVQSA